MMQSFFRDYYKAKALPPHPIFEQSESTKAHVIRTDMCRKFPMATAEAACVHPRAVL